MRALVVENDPATQQMLAELLDQYHIKVDAVATLADAMSSVDRCTPELVLLELVLPDGNGLRLLERIRTRGLPVTVAVISGAPNDLLADALVLYPQGLFDKPLDVPRFRGWVERAIRRILGHETY